LLTRQHIGAPAIPTVEPGQRVNQGDPVATPPEGALGARIHASISGTVAEVTDNHVIIEG
jgi:Na+-translocating ferredoxin:NAD+ oxidoreductase RnfC subunit